MQSPKKWSSLWSDRYKHRFWWDHKEETAQIQWLSPKGWKTIKKNAQPGWISSSLPLGTRFRIRFPSSTRWSDMLQNLSLGSLHMPSKKLWEPNHCPLITTFTSSDHTLWGGSKDKGLYRLHNPQKPHYFGMWDGLWDDQIIAMDGERISCSSEPQVAPFFFETNSHFARGEKSLFIHIFKLYPCKEMTCGWEDFGVCTEFGAEVEIKRREHSVFSIAPFSFGETLIGYDDFCTTHKDKSISFSSQVISMMFYGSIRQSGCLVTA